VQGIGGNSFFCLPYNPANLEFFLKMPNMDPLSNRAEESFFG
jgi:hypothetical protein